MAARRVNTPVPTVEAHDDRLRRLSSQLSIATSDLRRAELLRVIDHTLDARNALATVLAQRAFAPRKRTPA